MDCEWSVMGRYLVDWVLDYRGGVAEMRMCRTFFAGLEDYKKVRRDTETSPNNGLIYSIKLRS